MDYVMKEAALTIARPGDLHDNDSIDRIKRVAYVTKDLTAWVRREIRLLSPSLGKLDNELAQSIAALVAIGMMHQYDHDEDISNTLLASIGNEEAAAAVTS
jgi:hypothetical protein